MGERREPAFPSDGPHPARRSPELSRRLREAAEAHAPLRDLLLEAADRVDADARHRALLVAAAHEIEDGDGPMLAAVTPDALRRVLTAHGWEKVGEDPWLGSRFAPNHIGEVDYDIYERSGSGARVGMPVFGGGRRRAYNTYVFCVDLASLDRRTTAADVLAEAFAEATGDAERECARVGARTSGHE